MGRLLSAFRCLPALECRAREQNNWLWDCRFGTVGCISLYYVATKTSFWQDLCSLRRDTLPDGHFDGLALYTGETRCYRPRWHSNGFRWHRYNLSDPKSLTTRIGSKISGMQKYQVYWSLIMFFLAGLFEVGGCYLVWQTVKGNRPLWLGMSGGLMLVAYGLIATLHPAGFGKTYAAYGGFFVIISLLWTWLVDKVRPDLFDTVGAAVALLGTVIIFFAPRK